MQLYLHIYYTGHRNMLPIFIVSYSVDLWRLPDPFAGSRRYNGNNTLIKHLSRRKHSIGCAPALHHKICRYVTINCGRIVAIKRDRILRASGTQWAFRWFIRRGFYLSSEHKRCIIGGYSVPFVCNVFYYARKRQLCKYDRFDFTSFGTGSRWFYR